MILPLPNNHPSSLRRQTFAYLFQHQQLKQLSTSQKEDRQSIILLIISKISCYLSNALAYGDKAELFSGATNRLAVRTDVVVVGRINAAIVAEAQYVSVFAIWCTRPIGAVETHKAEGAIATVEIARSRIPALGARGEISLEVHSFVS